jgi:hypothetical protein
MEKIGTTLRRDRQTALLPRRTEEYDPRIPEPARDVPPGECWAFREHRSTADLIAEGLL